VTHKLLTIVVAESEKWEGVPLYEAIVRKLMHLGAPGATVQRGMMAYGRHHRRLHHEQLFGIADDRPITISVVHSEEALRGTVIPAIRLMVRYGVMFLMDAEVI